MKIELKDVSKKFKDIVVVENINMKFESGKIYSFIGRNGVGKSVILKMICGYLNPSSGIITYNDKVLNKDIKYPINTRCLIENPSFIPDLTGYENLKLLADIKKVIGKKEIEDALKLVNLYEEKDKKYSKYSLGMRQKLGIAQVLMENPEVIVLDEPFNGIENESVDKLRKVLLKEKEKGKLILIATHIKDDVKILSDEIYLVDNKNVKNI